MIRAAARNCVYLGWELLRSARESRTAQREPIDRLFASRVDPWGYDVRPEENKRLALQARMLDAAGGTRLFERGLEIGCAEGRCTEMLEARCGELVACDISPVALTRASARRAWKPTTTFKEFDLRRDAIEGTHDLVAVTGVLEYFSRRRTFLRVREKLASTLNPGGILLLETTEANPVVERAWWSRLLIRGRWINRFVARHPLLEMVCEFPGEDYHGMVLRKRAT